MRMLVAKIVSIFRSVLHARDVPNKTLARIDGAAMTIMGRNLREQLPAGHFLLQKSAIAKMCEPGLSLVTSPPGFCSA
jgi:hypothetical protein